MICENCGKEHDGHFGSGRYCSRACANSRHHSTETKQKISESIKKEIICYCQFCNKEFKNLTSLRSHERQCEENPNRIYVDNGLHEKKLLRNVKLKNGDVLDITYQELENYRSNHKFCEICGRTAQEASSKLREVKFSNLCVDHCHTTCNKQLGWFENIKKK